MLAGLRIRPFHCIRNGDIRSVTIWLAVEIGALQVMLQSRLFLRRQLADVLGVGALSAHVWTPVVLEVFKFHADD